MKPLPKNKSISQTKKPQANLSSSKTIPLDIREHEGGVTFPVIVQPRSKKNEIVGISEGALKVKVTALPVEGAANEALIKLLSQKLGMRKSGIEILRMKTTPRKLIQCQGLSVRELESLLKYYK